MPPLVLFFTGIVFLLYCIDCNQTLDALLTANNQDSIVLLYSAREGIYHRSLYVRTVDWPSPTVSYVASFLDYRGITLASHIIGPWINKGIKQSNKLIEYFVIALARRNNYPRFSFA